MPALNYQKQFAPKVESGTKRQTIRATRKRPFKRGDKLYHYTGMRTKSCRKLGESTCSLAVDIIMSQGEISYDHNVAGPDAESLAKADGFENAAAMFSWFEKTHGFPFVGQVIRWEELWG